MTRPMTRCRRIILSAVAGALVLAGALTSCTSSPLLSRAASVSCANYAVHAAGYRDEVQVLVTVTNGSSKPGRYTVAVDLNRKNAGTGTVASTRVTLTGLVPAKTSTQLSRKVLTTSEVGSCRIVGISRSS